MCENKTKLRQAFLKIRNDISFRAEKNCQIKQKVLELLQGKELFSLFSYVSMGSEVDTKEIISEFFGKTEVLIPHTEKNEMKLLPLLSLENKLETDKKGNIYSSVDADKLLPFNGSPSVTIVPMLAFNSSLCRLGYGGGYYDKFLSKKNTLKVGIAYDEQETDIAFNEPHDIPLDCIVTQTRIIWR